PADHRPGGTGAHVRHRGTALRGQARQPRLLRLLGLERLLPAVAALPRRRPDHAQAVGGGRPRARRAPPGRAVGRRGGAAALPPGGGHRRRGREVPAVIRYWLVSLLGMLICLVSLLVMTWALYHLVRTG